jgi:hypothetical protein
VGIRSCVSTRVFILSGKLFIYSSDFCVYFYDCGLVTSHPSRVIKYLGRISSHMGISLYLHLCVGIFSGVTGYIVEGSCFYGVWAYFTFCAFGYSMSLFA